MSNLVLPWIKVGLQKEQKQQHAQTKEVCVYLLFCKSLSCVTGQACQILAMAKQDWSFSSVCSLWNKHIKNSRHTNLFWLCMLFLYFCGVCHLRQSGRTEKFTLCFLGAWFWWQWKTSSISPLWGRFMLLLPLKVCNIWNIPYRLVTQTPATLLLTWIKQFKTFLQKLFCLHYLERF